MDTVTEYRGHLKEISDMKKVFFYILLTFALLCGCQNGQSANQTDPCDTVITKGNLSIDLDVPSSSGIYWYSWMEHPQWMYEGDAIPDAETALNVAKEIFYSTAGAKPHSCVYVADAIMYDEPNGYWIVTFVPPHDSDALLLSDCYGVVMQKKDGKVIQIMWME